MYEAMYALVAEKSALQRDQEQYEANLTALEEEKAHVEALRREAEEKVRANAQLQAALDAAYAKIRLLEAEIQQVRAEANHVVVAEEEQRILAEQLEEVKKGSEALREDTEQKIRELAVRDEALTEAGNMIEQLRRRCNELESERDGVLERSREVEDKAAVLEERIAVQLAHEKAEKIRAGEIQRKLEDAAAALDKRTKAIKVSNTLPNVPGSLSRRVFAHSYLHVGCYIVCLARKNCIPTL